MANHEMILKWIVVGILCSGASSKTFEDTLNNMVVYNGKIYIGAKNYIHVLNAADLSEVQPKIRTCSDVKCENVNKVLLVGDDKLIACGSQQGNCEIRPLGNLKDVTGNSSNDHASNAASYLAVSEDLSRPAVFVFSEESEKLYTGITYGTGLAESTKRDTYHHFLARYEVGKNSFTKDKNLDLKPEDFFRQYLVYFKGGFEHNGFIYFVTNQKFKVGTGGTYMSKLIRVCQNDTDFYSYTDIILSCQKNGVDYNLTQDVTIFEPGKELRDSLTASNRVIAATFAKGSGPDSLEEQSAICIYDLESINTNIVKAKEDFLKCPGSTIADSERYLPNNVGKNDDDVRCVKNWTSSVLQFAICLRDEPPSFYFITGDRSSLLAAEAVYTVNASDSKGYLTKIRGSVTQNYTVLHVGTSNGKLLKLNVNPPNADVFEERTVDLNRPIIGLHVESDGYIEYAMTDRKIMKYEPTKCDKWQTCEETMEARNPLCGWCVYEQKSTFKDNSSCPYQQYTGHWLSSLTQCLELDVFPKGLAVPITFYVNVNFTGVAPSLMPGYVYVCEVRAGQKSERKTEDLRCKTPRVTDHTDGEVFLYVKTPSNDTVLLAHTDLLFYDCAHYRRCGECVGDPRAKCSWNAHTTTCVPYNDSLDIFIQKEGKCAKFQNEDKFYLPSGVWKNLTFSVQNVGNVPASMNYSCKLNGQVFTAQKLPGSQISCSLQETTNNKTSEYTLEILYGTSYLDGNNTVVVYNCGELGDDCSLCRSLKYTNSYYMCDWCSGGCAYAETACSDTCSPPNVTGIVPNTAGLNGNITVTISGQEMGSRLQDVDSITLAGVSCSPLEEGFIPSTRVACKVGASAGVKEGNVVVVVKNKNSTGYARFEYKKPTIKSVSPIKGPQAGGTTLTIKGEYLGIGTRMVKVSVTGKTKRKTETKECTDAKVMPELSLHSISYFWIECNTPVGTANGSSIESVKITFDGGTEGQKTINFTYLENPEIDLVRPMKDIASGGINQTVTGKRFLNANKGFVKMKCGNDRRTKVEFCIVKSNTEMICQVPELCEEEKIKIKNISRRKRETRASTGAVQIEIIIYLDGVQQSFSISYYSDPSFSPFDEDNKVKLFESKNKKLTIMGSYLNLVAGEDDVIVTIGVGNCDVIELRETNLTCVAPTNQPAAGTPGSSLPEVNVSIGNVHRSLGYLRYVEIQEELAKIYIIIAVVIGAILLVVVIIVVALVVKYKQKSKEMKEYERHVEEQEMEIKKIFREEFADMHTSMLVVSNSLIEQGCPYHHYQQYVFNVLFPADKMDSHPLLQEPVVSKKVTDDMRSKMKRGMEEFENLIYNKYFLKSVINSLEGQRKFGLKDKANMCGYICTILLGRMEYLQEILVDLLGNLVEESAGKKNQKVLFRSCDTITKKLLSNWLSLCLYPHLKSQSGYPLYLLYKATQLHMEAGPIDAITNDAKYTLSEEKLLKKYNQQAKQGSDEPAFEAKCLTLNVVVDNCRDIKVCRVLDCDTITQVKDKCLTQIYVNYPASNLTVKPEELELEWHAGQSGSLRLRDEDNTSKRHGDWVRLNTLAHYNVQDGSNMALIDPQVADASQEQDYANLAQVQVSCPSPSEISIDSTDALTASLVESGERHIRYWHIVKPEEGTLAPGKSLIAELYLNRLLTFKQSILDYVKAIFDTVLKEDVLPAHVHYLYNLLDGLAKKHNIEPDILHTWKSEIYPVRIWAHLMKKPSVVFDIKSPPYVDTSMDVISQVFIDCFSLESHKFGKDSPTHKMIFNSEMNHYKERVKQFYKGISVTESQPLSLRRSLEEVNKLQQQHASFNKMTALHKLYQQIEPYMLEITDDLANDKDACKLHLNQKLEQINGLMEEE